MGIFANFSILNQRGTPAMFSDILANRPAPGFVGRIFIDTNVPTTGIYRDTGTTWEIIAGGIPVTPTLQAVTDAGNTTTNNVIMESRAIVGGTSLNNLHRLFVRDTGVFTNQRDSLVAERTHTYNAGTTFINGPGYTSIGGYDVLNLAASITYPNGVSAASGVYSGVTIRPAGFNITQTQGAGIRALSAFRSQLTFEQSSLTNSTISHFAHFFATAIFKTNNSNPVTITNNYGLAISDQTEVSTGLTVTNRFGIAQFGVNDRNFFLGRVGIGTSVDAGFGFDVRASAAFIGTGDVRINHSGTAFFDIRNSVGTIMFSANNGSNGIFVSSGSLSNTFSIASNQTIFQHSASSGTWSNNPLRLTTNYTNVNSGGTNRNLFLIDPIGNIGSVLDYKAIFVDFSGITSVGLGTLTAFANNIGNNSFNSSSGSTIIGGSTINSSAKLQVDSNNSGFLPPRMTTTERNAIATPAAGLMIYNTTTGRHQGFNGTVWNDFY